MAARSPIRVRFAWVAALVASACFPSARVEAQAVQVFRGISPPSAEKEPERLRVWARARRAVFTDSLKSSARRGDADAGKRAVNLIDATHKVEEFADDPEIVRPFVERVERGDSTIGIESTAPILRALMPDVMFTLGAGATSDASGTSPDLSIGTNAVGALSSRVFEALSLETFRDYARNNISLGMSFPGRDRTRLSSQVGLGLGLYELGSTLHVAPMLGIEQMSRADRRVPSRVREGAASQESWSTPYVGVSAVFGDTKKLVERVRAHRLVWPAVTLGVGLPHWYPGNAVEGLGAIFSNDHAKYVRSNRERLMLSLDLPLAPPTK